MKENVCVYLSIFRKKEYDIYKKKQIMHCYIFMVLFLTSLNLLLLLLAKTLFIVLSIILIRKLLLNKFCLIFLPQYQSGNFLIYDMLCEVMF